MLRLAADENFNNHIVRGLRRREPRLDIVRVQDAGLSGAEDTEVLAWAAGEGRILLTHDTTTVPFHLYDLVSRGELVPGVLAVGRAVTVAAAIEDILLLAECGIEGEWEGHILYLPLR